MRVLHLVLHARFLSQAHPPETKKPPRTMHRSKTERAAQAVLKTVTVDLPEGEEPPEIQVVLTSKQAPVALRQITSGDMHRLVKVPGIVISASSVRPKAATVVAKCSKCGNVKHLSCGTGLKAIRLPQYCDRGGVPLLEGEEKCPIEPYEVRVNRFARA